MTERPAGRAATNATPTTAAARGRHRYDRARDLPRLLPMWPWEMQTADAAQHGARLLARLRRALREERRRGLGGHWSYDLARHAQLLAAYRAEVVLSGASVAHTATAPGKDR